MTTNYAKQRDDLLTAIDQVLITQYRVTTDQIDTACKKVTKKKLEVDRHIKGYWWDLVKGSHLTGFCEPPLVPPSDDWVFQVEGTTYRIPASDAINLLRFRVAVERRLGRNMSKQRIGHSATA